MGDEKAVMNREEHRKERSLFHLRICSLFNEVFSVTLDCMASNEWISE
jgi:hypothetical protein